MSIARALCLKQVALVVAATIACNVTACCIFAQAEVTCESRSCVEFVQWRYVSGDTYQYREAVGGEKWGYLSACCHPNMDPVWCMDKNNLLNMGTSSRRVMATGGATCTSATCSGDRVQVSVSNMGLELASATRSNCYTSDEE